MTDKLKDKLHEKAEQEVEVRGHKMEKADIFKFVGLIAFFAIMVLIVVMLWPYFHELFEPGGSTASSTTCAARVPWGSSYCWDFSFCRSSWRSFPARWCRSRRACCTALDRRAGHSGRVRHFQRVHLRAGAQAGAPFVQSMVPVQYLEKFRKFEKTGKLNIIVFILFLIPGLPKDVFTYLVPLTDMRMRTFLLLSNVGRIPGIVVSTYAADGLADGRLMESAIIFAVAAVIAVLGIVFRERIMKMLEKHSHKDS